MIDLFIIGFACISIAAFASTKDNNKNKQELKVKVKSIFFKENIIFMFLGLIKS